MLARLIEDETNVVVLIYREGNVQDGDTVKNLDRIDADLDGKDVDFVKCSHKGLEKNT